MEISFPVSPHRRMETVDGDVSDKIQPPSIPANERSTDAVVVDRIDYAAMKRMSHLTEPHPLIRVERSLVINARRSFGPEAQSLVCEIASSNSHCLSRSSLVLRVEVKHEAIGQQQEIDSNEAYRSRVVPLDDLPICPPAHRNEVEAETEDNH
jgi:hypothetical protein